MNFHGEKRSNDTHESKTDPDARLARKSGGHESKLAYCGNAMIENRNGLVVDTELVQSSGTAERDAALLMAGCIPGTGRATVAGDKGYDTRDFVATMREMNVTPHVAQNEKRPGGSAIDGQNHAPCRIQGQPAQTETNRRSLRLAEDGGHAAQDQTPGAAQSRMGLYLRSHCL